jgi:hypothetical protein
MFRHIAIGIVLTSLAKAQDNVTVPSIDVSSLTPTLTTTEHFVTGSPPPPTTQETITLTNVSCIPQESQLFSIQTDTVLHSGPLTVTPVCEPNVPGTTWTTSTESEMGPTTTATTTSGGGRTEVVTSTGGGGASAQPTQSSGGARSAESLVVGGTRPPAVILALVLGFALL